MDFSRITLILISIFFLTACGNNRGSNKCTTELSYITNPFTSGEEAIRHASEYRANFIMGSDDFNVSGVVDTASADLVVNEANFIFGKQSSTGNVPFIVDSGVDRAIALNTKDEVDIGCLEDFSTRFVLTAKDPGTDNVIGLAFSDPDHHPHEKKTVPFLAQLVKKAGIFDAFSLALCGPKGNSRLLLGGVDSFMERLLYNFIPIIEKTAYVVPALSLRFAETKKNVASFPLYDPSQKTGIRTIIDSASSFMLLPSDMALSMARHVQLAADDLMLSSKFPEGFFRTERSNSTKVARFLSPSQIRKFPTFEITFLGFDGKEKALELSPLHYFKEMDNDDPMIRTFAVRETNADVVLGQPFLENHYVFFDRNNARIGFGNIDLACVE